mgnify:CR=1 FL=1|jgi:hypothetical protein
MSTSTNGDRSYMLRPLKIGCVISVLFTSISLRFSNSLMARCTVRFDVPIRSAIVCCDGYGFFAVSHQLAVKFRRTFSATELIPSVFCSISKEDGIAVHPMINASSPHFSFNDDDFIAHPSKKCFFFRKKIGAYHSAVLSCRLYLKIEAARKHR